MTELLPSYRVVTFVPAGQAEAFITALGPHVPAFLGGYEQVLWFSAAGTEQFRERGAGGPPRREPSVRVEVSVPREDAALQKLIEEGIKPHHPWREPVILVFDGRIAAEYS